MRILTTQLRRCTSALLMISVASVVAFAQSGVGLPYVESLRVTPRDSVAHLSHAFIVAGSASITLSGKALADSTHYTLDVRHGIVTFRPASIRLSFPLPDSGVAVQVSYHAWPIALKEVYRHNTPVASFDSVRKVTTITARPAASFALDDLFGPNLQKSGSIVRGFTFGSNRDLSLNSGLRMQLSGPLSNDLSLVAALTDENSPLQPEGTTKTIQEVDKVFVELHGERVSATLGDFNVDAAGSAFGSYSRKLQGARATATFDVGNLRSSLDAVAAAPRGKFFANAFQGLDGVQGPYRLFGKNNEPQIVVIAATERVYINGERMTRGEGNDYTIDYSTAEVTFTPHRLITSAARITVDFEYSDRQFDRSFYSAAAEESWNNDRWALRAGFARESDNENSPIDVALADSDRAFLRNTGGDPSKAYRSGIVLVGAGKGAYVKIDTIVAAGLGLDSAISIYRFNPFDTLNAIYAVTFSYVGGGKGDYHKVSTSRYDFAGRGRGDYAPIRFLPLPTSQLVVNGALKGKITDEFSVGGELAHSQVNQNLFAVDPLARLDGSAATLSLAYDTKALRLGGISLGGVNAEFRGRHLDQSFQTLDRLDAVEFNRLWNITDSTASAEDDRQAILTLRPADSLRFSGSIGRLSRGASLTSTRSSGSAAWGVGEAHLEYGFDRVVRDDAVHRLSDDWVRQQAGVEQRLGGWTPFVRYNGELLLSRSVAGDTLAGASYRMNEIQPGIRIDSIDYMRIELGAGMRTEDSLTGGGLQRAVNATSASVNWQLRGWNDINSMLDFSLLDKRFPRTPALDGDASRSIALRWQGHYLPGSRIVETDMLYELLTERTARLERVFQQVPRGTGNYQYAGDVNNNHVIDEDDFRPVRFDGDFIAVTIPSDQLVPVTGVRASARLRFNGYQVASSGSIIRQMLKIFSFETYARVDEKNTDPKKSDIYLLRFSHFLDDRLTIAGSSLVTQDCYLFETNPKFSLRARYSEGRSLTQFALGTERTYRREQSVRVRWQFLEEFSNQTDVALERDALAGSAGNPRLREVGLTTLSSDWSYRPMQRLEIGFRFGTGRGKNFDSVTVGLNDQTARLVYALNDRGQARVEFSREEAEIISGSGALPFELTGGRVVGQSWLWHVALDYRITRSLQSSLSYDGRREGRGNTIHTARAEVRAFF